MRHVGLEIPICVDGKDDKSDTKCQLKYRELQLETPSSRSGRLTDTKLAESHPIDSVGNHHARKGY
jgi:hypothetical protein